MGYKIASTDGEVAGDIPFDKLDIYSDLSGDLSSMLDILTGYASTDSKTGLTSYPLKKFVKYIRYKEEVPVKNTTSSYICDQ